jgi:hypothetical protein
MARTVTLVAALVVGLAFGGTGCDAGDLTDEEISELSAELMCQDCDEGGGGSSNIITDAPNYMEPGIKASIRQACAATPGCPTAQTEQSIVTWFRNFFGGGGFGALIKWRVDCGWCFFGNWGSGCGCV